MQVSCYALVVSKTTQKHEFDVLLATGSSGGTISAVRELSRSGLRVGLIASRLLCPGSWSRHTAITFRGPEERDNQKFLDLLLRIGSSSPGRVLIATSDETAWLYTRNSSLLSKCFRLHQPPIATMERILDKKLLSVAAMEAGLEVLPTWEPRDLAEVIAAAPTLPYPILIKPRTQVSRKRNDKGTIAHSEKELIENFREYVEQEERSGQGSLVTEEIAIPMLQQFVQIGAEGVHSVSGYIDKTQELFVTRHTKKIFQRSQPAGVGVCFESVAANHDLSAAVRRLCHELNYFGIFEVEFIKHNGRWAVIDFNPRLFNQAGIDAYRGMPLALFAYLDATGKTNELREAIAAAKAQEDCDPAVFYDRFTLRAILLAKSLTRCSSAEEHTLWRDWMKRNQGCAVDVAADASDRWPGLIHALSETLLGVKGFKRFLRNSTRVTVPTEALPLKVHQ